MRIVKEHDVRKSEIIDTAERLFLIYGYSKCSVNQILDEIGIAKGTFYHYFKSKEEVLDAIVQRTADIIGDRAEAIVKERETPSIMKLLKVFMAMNIQEEMDLTMLNEMHKPENALMHQKSLVAAVDALIPSLEAVVKEGIQAGEFECEYPKPYMKIFLSSAITLMDDGIFQVPKEEEEELFVALMTLLGKMLGIEKKKMMEYATNYLHP